MALTEQPGVQMPARALVTDQPGQEIRLVFQSDTGNLDVAMTPMQAVATAGALMQAAAKRLGAIRCPICKLFQGAPERDPVAAGKPFMSTETSPSGKLTARKTLR